MLLKLKCLGNKVIWSASNEEDATKRCDGLLCLPQEWHKKKVGFNRKL